MAGMTRGRRRAALGKPKPQVPIGITCGGRLSGLSSAAMDTALDFIVSTGATWVREDMDWNAIQPSNSSTFNWSGWDLIATKCVARGLSMLPIVAYTPPWARPGGTGGTFSTPPASNATFATYAAAAVTRYRDWGIHHWEVWNEPNQRGFWGDLPVSPTNYTALLAAAYTAMKAVDPTATIITAGTAANDGLNGYIDARDWFDQILTAGANSSCDAYGHHPYSFPVPPDYHLDQGGNPDGDWNHYRQIKFTTPNLIGILASHGVTNKKIWCTEYGAPTGGPGALATTANFYGGPGGDHVDEALQAQMATDVVTLARGRDSDAIAAVFWHTNDDLSATDTTTSENWFGLRHFNLTAKPAFAAFRTAIAST